MRDQKKQWVDDLEAAIEARFETLVMPLLQNSEDSLGCHAIDITETAVFPISEQTDPQQATRAGTFWIDESWDRHMCTITLKEKEVPDWLYGFISHQNNAHLPENGTADECKDGIIAVMEESAAAVIRRVSACLTNYAINVVTAEADLLTEHITLHCVSDKAVMQVNTIMGNKTVRSAMPPRAMISVSTRVEENRRTDDYLRVRPDQQRITRKFFYENGRIVRDEPLHWSAGMQNEPGDILRIGSIVHRIGSAQDRSWQYVAHDGDPVAGRDDKRRLQVGTPFQPGERAYWNIARNR
jgi:hypothetical protein